MKYEQNTFLFFVFILHLYLFLGSSLKAYFYLTSKIWSINEVYLKYIYLKHTSYIVFSVRGNALATLTTTFEEYKELLIDSINNLTWHSYLAKAQARYVKSKKESLSANKVTLLRDFAENYQYLIQDEMQNFHWSKVYCKLHPLVIYYKYTDGNLQHYSLCFISDDNTHNTSFVHKIQTLLVKF